MSKMFTWMKQSKLSLLLALILAVGLLVGGCGGGSDSYDDYTQQSLTRTDSPLIEAETLKEWMDAGLVNAGYMQDNVVILNVDPATADRIPGAYSWIYEDEVRTTREEGLSLASSMVQTGDVIDPVLQRSGVNDLTTIVLTSSTRLDYATVAYFTLRYWGFPKDRIKILQGLNEEWDIQAATWGPEYALDDKSPADVKNNPFNFSVRNNGSLNDNVRFSMAEIIQAVDANNASFDKIAKTGVRTINIVQNTTSADTATLSTAIGRSSNDFRSPSGSNYYLSKEDIETFLNTPTAGTSFDDNFNNDLPTVTHCGSGLTCTIIFFALDGILDMDDVAVWDGSTTQWRRYGNLINPDEFDDDGDPLWTVPEAWDVNANDRSNSVQNRLAARGDLAVPLDTELINQFLRIQEISDPAFNQIEEEDKRYMEAAGENGAPEAGADVEGGC